MASLRRLIQSLQRWFRGVSAVAPTPAMDATRTPLELYLLAEGDPAAGQQMRR